MKACARSRSSAIGSWTAGLALFVSQATLGQEVTYKILHEFNPFPEGGHPGSTFVQGADGSFYGTTSLGGAHGHGTIFKVDPEGRMTAVYSFDAEDGANFASSLTPDGAGGFYGTTAGDGGSNKGIIFRLDAAGIFSTLHVFHGEDGDGPRSLTPGPAGTFYGVTFSGGAEDRGTIFELDSAGFVTTLHSFKEGDGAGAGALSLGPDGRFYGIAGSGGVGFGVLFRLDVGSGPRLRRGDANDDGAVDMSDAIATLGHLFLGTEAPPCLDAADSNDDGALDLSDAVHTLGYLFLGSAPPPGPFPDCGADPTEDGLGCAAVAGCP